MDWATAYYVKLYRSQSPDWLALSPLTRGIFDELLLIADKAGRIQLGKAGLPSIAVPLRGTWAELEAHVRALLDDGCLVLDDGAVVIRGFVEAQKRAKTPVERKADQREREKVTPAPSRPARSRTPTTHRDASRDVTTSHAGHDKEQTDQKEKIPPTPQVGPSIPEPESSDAARREEPASLEPSPPTAPTESDLVRAYVRGVEQATAGTFGRKLDADDRGQLEYLWELHASGDEPAAAPDFLRRLTEGVTEWVTLKNTPAERKYQAGWSVKRFVAWLQERADAANDPPPGHAPSGPAWGEPTDEELARLGRSQGAA